MRKKSLKIIISTFIMSVCISATVSAASYSVHDPDGLFSGILTIDWAYVNPLVGYDNFVTVGTYSNVDINQMTARAYDDRSNTTITDKTVYSGRNCTSVQRRAFGCPTSNIRSTHTVDSVRNGTWADSI